MTDVVEVERGEVEAMKGVVEVGKGVVVVMMGVGMTIPPLLFHHFPRRKAARVTAAVAEKRWIPSKCLRFRCLQKLEVRARGREKKVKTP